MESIVFSPEDDQSIGRNDELLIHHIPALFRVSATHGEIMSGSGSRRIRGIWFWF